VLYTSSLVYQTAAKKGPTSRGEEREMSLHAFSAFLFDVLDFWLDAKSVPAFTALHDQLWVIILMTMTSLLFSTSSTLMALMILLTLHARIGKTSAERPYLRREEVPPSEHD
jgi:hypothetical protein